MTIYQDKLKALEDRTVQFSIEVIRFCQTRQNDPLMKPILIQLIKSATSIGANYAEANNASSRTDFKSKIFIAKKEAGETRYWLRILEELVKDFDLKPLQQEALELNLIFQKIILSLKSGKFNNEK